MEAELLHQGRLVPEATPPTRRRSRGATRGGARGALRYGLAQGWNLDVTTCRSVNIQEALDLVAHTGQMEVSLHTRGRHGGPPEGIGVESTGMVLVLAAVIVRGVLHASDGRRARPQWTIQVSTTPRAWPFSTWAVLAVMWHVAPEGTPKGTAEGIAWDLHAWPADQDFPWRNPRGASQWRPRQRGSASRRPSSNTPTIGRATSC